MKQKENGRLQQVSGSLHKIADFFQLFHDRRWRQIDTLREFALLW
jgi:hypothetical protein